MAKGESNGKYPVTLREPGYAVAGNRTEGLGSGNSNTTKRGFKGSGIRSYTFTRVINGSKRTQTIRAHSVKEANKIAATQGFKTTDREIKRRKKRKK